VGEISLTGLVRQGAALEQRLAAARAAGIGTVLAPAGTAPSQGVRIVPVRHVKDALTWAGTSGRRSSAAAARSAEGLAERLPKGEKSL
jgi:predicted ATP-dependent serine protease